jgi:hypothetical protein
MGGIGSGRKKKSEEENSVLPAFQAGMEEPANSAREPYTPADVPVAPKVKPRMTFTVTPDGMPDFSALRANQRDFLKRVLTSSEVKAQLGVAEQTVELPPMFTEQDVRALYAMLGPVEGYAFALALKCPVPLAAKIFTYTEDDLAILTAPTVALLNKYQAWLGGYAKWKEEITFAMVFISVTQKKLSMLRLDIQRIKDAQAANPAIRDYIKERAVAVTEAPAPAPVNGSTTAVVEEGFATVNTDPEKVTQ